MGFEGTSFFEGGRAKIDESLLLFAREDIDIISCWFERECTTTGAIVYVVYVCSMLTNPNEIAITFVAAIATAIVAAVLSILVIEGSSLLRQYNSFWDIMSTPD